MLLDILISTIDKRIEQTKNVLLGKRDDVNYIVSHQYTDINFKYIPKELLREDVVVSQIPGKGLTSSRNNALSLASGDIALFSDDDVTYTDENINRVLNAFFTDPSPDVAIFKIKTPDGDPEYKNYPKVPKKLTGLPFSISSIEVAIKIEKIRENRILFDERFGAGKPLLIGSEESIFIMDCIKAGLNVWYYPIYVVQHPFESTIKSRSKYDKFRVSVAGAFDSRVNGWISIPKAFFNTIRIFPDLIRHKKNPLIYLKERLFASFYILFTKAN